jgi:hypothetical protein
MLDFGAFARNIDPGVTCPGDANGDFNVDCADYYILMSCWESTTPDCAAADFNHDGIVDMLDLSALLTYWTGPPGPCP